MNINTQKLTNRELQLVVKERARAEGKDLTDPKNRYTIWIENGPWSSEAVHLNFEDSAADLSEKERKVRASIMKNGGARTMILDAVQDQIEIRLSDGKTTEVPLRS